MGGPVLTPTNTQRRVPVSRAIPSMVQSWETLALGLARGWDAPLANLLGWILLVALVLLIFRSDLSLAVFPLAEGDVLAYPYLIYEGMKPHIDMWPPYPVGTYALIAALFKVLGPRLIVERTFSLVTRFLFIVVLNRAVSGNWLRVSWAGVFIAAVFTFSPTEHIFTYAWYVGLPLVVAALVVQRSNILLAVSLFFLSALFRIEFGLLGALDFGVLWLLSMVQHRQVRFTRDFRSAIGLLLLLVVGFGAMDITTNGLALHDIVMDQIAVAPGRELPMQPPWLFPLDYPLAVAIAVLPLSLVIVGLVR